MGKKLRMLIYWSISAFTNIHKLENPSNLFHQLQCTHRQSMMTQLFIEDISNNTFKWKFKTTAKGLKRGPGFLDSLF